MKLEPANTIVRFLGGAQAVAAIVNRHQSRVYRWAKPKEDGGTDGLVPARDQRTLLEHARANDIDLRPDDFFSEDRLLGLLSAAKEAAE